jgi:hypothetical protein
MDSELILAESWRQCVTVFSSQKNRYHKFLGASKIFDLLSVILKGRIIEETTSINFEARDSYLDFLSNKFELTYM